MEISAGQKLHVNACSILHFICRSLLSSMTVFDLSSIE